MRTALRGPWRLYALVMLGALALVAGGIAWASIPEGGVYTGCYKKDGNLRVIDASKDCKKDETRITWNQQGPQGIQGEPGLPGSGGAVLVQRDVYQSGGPETQLHLTVGVPTLLSTVPKPDGGTAGSPWNKALVTAVINMGNVGSPQGFVWCQFSNGGGTGFTVDRGAVNTATLATWYQRPDPNVQLTCKSHTEGADIWVGWVDTAVIPASSVVTNNHTPS